MLPQFIVSLFIVYVYIYLKSKKSFHMLQQNWYNEGNRYIKWIFENKKKVFLQVDIMFLIFIIGFWIDTKIEMTIFIVVYMLIALCYLQTVKKEQVKKPLVFTSRVKRLCVTTFIIYILPIIWITFHFNELQVTWYYIIIGFIVYINYFIVWIANIINKPIEACIRLKFKRRAMHKLKSMTNMKVIGITGSYGKTSSKNILSDILNVKYNALPTPKNFNTPLGLIRTINNDLDKFNDLFIAEMGAFKKGEIQELCDLVHPTYGILTKILSLIHISEPTRRP